MLQSIDGSMTKQVKVLVKKAQDWRRHICSNNIKCHLAWQSMCCGVWRSLAYVLLATNFSQQQGEQISSALYHEALPLLGTNHNFLLTLQYFPSSILVWSSPTPLLNKVSRSFEPGPIIQMLLLLKITLFVLNWNRASQLEQS